MIKSIQIKPDAIFTPSAPDVYSMPSGTNFLTALAQTLQTALGDTLSEAMIFLPTRRAARGLTDAFLNLSGGQAVLLPRLRTLADMEENEPPFAPGDLALKVPQAIPDAERRFALSKLIAAKMTSEIGAPVDAAAALAMADPLLSVLNDLSTEELPLDSVIALNARLDILPEHQQDAVAFIEILSQTWPHFLKAKNLIEPIERRVDLLNAASEKWQNHPPSHPVIVAGSTGSQPATARFIKTVAQLPKGIVVLPGLDLNLDEKVWTAIDDQHPQAALRHLLETLAVNRAQVAIWPMAGDTRARRNRERVLAESLIPVETTADWPTRIAKIEKDISEKGGVKAALAGLSLIETTTSEEEAAVIALIMRGALASTSSGRGQEKDCVLVTPDPSLARRVRTKLSRFGIEADSSAGEPLEETKHGAFLSLTLKLALDRFDPVTLNDLYTHPLFWRPKDGLTRWYGLDKDALRGARPQDLDAMAARLEKSRHKDALILVEDLYETLTPLFDLGDNPHCPSVWAVAHTKAIEAAAGGADHIWIGEAGEKAASMLEELMQYGFYFDPVDIAGYTKLLSTLMRGRVVRPKYGTETRLKILGPLEARMISADTIILGGLNEGVWPVRPVPHPLLSRGMRNMIGLRATERRFGQSAHDFAELANQPNVIMTRSDRSDDGPQVMSRWLWRLKTLVKGALESDSKSATGAVKLEAAFAPPFPYLDWARAIDFVPENPKLVKQPMPNPAPEKRWPEGGRRLSVTQIQKWIRDPYSIYADKVLGLRPLDLADLPLGGREFGTAVHAALEGALKSGNHTGENILNALKTELRRAGYQPYQFARMMPNIETTADWTSDWIKGRRASGWQLVGSESYGKIQIPLGSDHKDFTLSGIADLIEVKNAGASVIDFKTGSSSSKNVIEAGFDPQLPLLAVMANEAAFGRPLTVTNLSYVKPNKQDVALSLDGAKVDDLMVEALGDLKKLIINFDSKDTIYYSQPRAQYTNPYGDYDHLARRAEWAALGDDSGGPQ